MQNEDRPKNFRKLSDVYNVAATNAAAYAPYLGIMAATEPEKIPSLLMIIPCMFLALRVPYLREAPMALSRLFMKAMIRGKEPADDKIKNMVEKLAEKAGMKPPKVTSYSKGATDNAAAATNQIYVGKMLSDRLNDQELEYVLAHELSHIKTKDISEMYLSWPPLANSFFTMAAMATTAVQAPSLATGLMAVGSLAYIKYQGLLVKNAMRTIEYRADRNALQLTGNLNAAVSGYLKIAGIEEIFKKPTLKETINASHPIGQKRIIGLCEAFNEQSGADKNSPLDIEIPPFFTLASTYYDELGGNVRATVLQGRTKESLSDEEWVETSYPRAHYENGTLDVISTEKLVKQPRTAKP